MITGYLTYIFPVCLSCLLSPDVQANSFDSVNIYVSYNRQSMLVEKKLVDNLASQNIAFSIHTIKYSNPDDPGSVLKNSLNITVGTDAARYLLGKEIDTPVYSVLIPEVTFYNLIKGSEFYISRLGQGKLGAFFIDQPLRRYLSLARMMGSGIMNIALFQDSEQHEIDLNKPVIESAEFNLQSYVLSGENPSISKIENILSQSDLAIIRPGKYLNPFVSKWILYAAYREKVPVISFSENFLDAGSVASLSSDIDRIATEITENVIKILTSGTMKPGGQYSKYYKLRINRSAARFLNIRLPEHPVLD